MSVPRVRVGIVSWNTAALLDTCLTSLPAALDGVDADTVVVDNDSADASAEIAESHSGVKVIRNESNRGYARAMNQALQGAGYEILIALNPDTDPPPSSLATLCRRLLEQPGVGLVAPRLVGADGVLQHSAYRFPSLAVAATVGFLPPLLQRGRVGRYFWLEGASPHDASCDVDWMIGAVHVMRASAVDPDRAYSERWFMYAEDLDLCFRLAGAGWRRRLEAEVTVPHIGNASGVQAWGGRRMARWMAASYDWYAQAHGEAAARRWALVNAAGVTANIGAFGLVAVCGGRWAMGARGRVKELLDQLPMHTAVIRQGTPPPEEGR